jgi:hypothetical protein
MSSVVTEKLWTCSGDSHFIEPPGLRRRGDRAHRRSELTAAVDDETPVVGAALLEMASPLHGLPVASPSLIGARRGIVVNRDTQLEMVRSTARPVGTRLANPMTGRNLSGVKIPRHAMGTFGSSTRPHRAVAVAPRAPSPFPAAAGPTDPR